MKRESISLAEWAEKHNFNKLYEEIKIHIENLCPVDITEEDVETMARCIMISLRQELEDREQI